MGSKQIKWLFHSSLGDRLQARLSSRKINSETQIERLCVRVLCCEVVLEHIYSL